MTKLHKFELLLIFGGTLISALFAFLSNVLLVKYISVAEYGRLMQLYILTIIYFGVSEMELFSRLVLILNNGNNIVGTGLYKNYLLTVIRVLLFTFPIIALVSFINIKTSLEEIMLLFCATILMILSKIKSTFYQISEQWLKYSTLEIINATSRLLFTIITVIILGMGYNLKSWHIFLLVFTISYIIAQFWDKHDYTPQVLDREPIEDHGKRQHIYNAWTNILYTRFDTFILAILIPPNEYAKYIALLLLANMIRLFTKSLQIFSAKVASKTVSLTKLYNVSYLTVLGLAAVVLIIHQLEEFIIDSLYSAEYLVNTGGILTIFIIMNVLGVFAIQYEIIILKYKPIVVLKHRMLSLGIMLFGYCIVFVNHNQLLYFAIVTLMAKLLYWLLNSVYLKRQDASK